MTIEHLIQQATIDLNLVINKNEKGVPKLF